MNHIWNLKIKKFQVLTLEKLKVTGRITINNILYLIKIKYI